MAVNHITDTKMRKIDITTFSKIPAQVIGFDGLQHGISAGGPNSDFRSVKFGPQSTVGLNLDLHFSWGGNSLFV